MGMTDKGLTTKRQEAIIKELKEAAKPIFQDLVPVGDVVDTSDSSTIGRLIGMISEPLSDLHEMGEEIYAAFDPESSYGVALDNLVALFGVTRRNITATTSLLTVWGDVGLYLPTYNTQVRGMNSQIFRLVQPAFLETSNCIGARMQMENPTNGKKYIMEVTSGTSTYEFTVTATASSTITSVVQEMYMKINNYSSVFVAGYGENYVTIELVDYNNTMSVVADKMMAVKLKGKVNSENVVRGAIPQPKDTLVNIATPILGWDSVTNPADGIRGNDRETDEELRLRFKHSKFLRAQNIGDSLYSILSGLSGARYVAIYENDTNLQMPEYDLPPHSFKVVMQGASDDDVAKGIWNNKPLGISCQGNTSVQIRDSQGYVKVIKFERPVPVNVRITMKIKIDEGIFPPNGVDKIKENLINYIGTNFGIGDDVIYSRLFTPINNVAGHQVNELKIGVAGGTLGQANIPVGYNRVSSVGIASIEIVVEN